jgi:hypothetical protein
MPPSTVKAKPNLRGRPSGLDDVVRERDGQPVTAAEAIIELVRTGMPPMHAASSVGFVREIYSGWLRNAARARKRLLAWEHGVEGAQEPSDKDLVLAEFLDSMESAASTAMATEWTRLGMLAAGGLPVEKTVTTVKVAVDDKGNETVIERTTKTEREKTLPSVQALTWRMTRRWPEVFGDRVALTGADGGPVELDVTAAGLVSRLRGIIDATSTERPERAVGAEPGQPGDVVAAVAQSGVGAQEAWMPSPDVDVPEPPG